MAYKILIDEAYQALKSDGELFGRVADALNVSPFTMTDLVRKKSKRLTEYASLDLIAKFIGKGVDEIVINEKATA